MLSYPLRKPIMFNIRLSNYCQEIINKTKRKLTEKYNLERNKSKADEVILIDDFDNDPKFNFNRFIIFLSIPSILFYFYKRLK